MAFRVDSGFRVTSAEPADIKYFWNSTASLVTSPVYAYGYISSSWRYEGMRVYCNDDKSEYQLIGGTLDANWKKISISGTRTTSSYAYTSSNFTGNTLTLSQLTSSTCRIINQIGVGDESISYKLQVSGTIAPSGDGIHPLGSPTNRFSDLYALQTTVGAFFEVGLRTVGVGKNPTGTIVCWKNGGLIPCYEFEDEMVMGVIKEGKDEPIILGAEYILVTGKIKEGDYIVTSNKLGHGIAAKRGILFKRKMFGKVIAQALESSNSESNLIKAMIRKM